MKIEEYIKNRNDKPVRTARSLGEIEAFMITHERPGMLSRTIQSFRRASPYQPLDLTVFDDGSTTPEKIRELDEVERGGVRVIRLPKTGFIQTWLTAWDWARKNKTGLGGLVLLEDDLSFARGWDGILRTMYEGAAELGYLPGAMSCLMVHDVPQMKVVDLNGVEAYQSMGHGFQVNLMPWEVIEAKEIQEKAAEDAGRGYHGIDIYLIGAISDRMGRTNFITTRSWVAHEGISTSIVEGQGYRSLKHRGTGLVDELTVL